MSEKIKLAFCVHSHQPVGNYASVFEQGTRECYLPFLRILKQYPEMRMTLHYTGPLLEWFEGHAPEFFDTLSLLVERSQVELMGGGFYEPIMPVIPERDALAQIGYSTTYLEERFGVRPRGVWCTERIWDPSLPRKIRAGETVEYTLLDDSHFLSAGLCPEDVHGYYITEREGYPLKVFPIDMNLRYLIPFKEPGEIIEYLLRLRSRGEDGHLRGRRREVRHVARDPHVGHRAGVAQEVLRRHAHGHGQDRGRAPGGRRGPVSVPGARLPAHGDVPGDDGVEPAGGSGQILRGPRQEGQDGA